MESVSKLQADPEQNPVEPLLCCAAHRFVGNVWVCGDSDWASADLRALLKGWDLVSVQSRVRSLLWA